MGHEQQEKEKNRLIQALETTEAVENQMVCTVSHSFTGGATTLLKISLFRSWKLEYLSPILPSFRCYQLSWNLTKNLVDLPQRILMHEDDHEGNAEREDVGLGRVGLFVPHFRRMKALRANNRRYFLFEMTNATRHTWNK